MKDLEKKLSSVCKTMMLSAISIDYEVIPMLYVFWLGVRKLENLADYFP